MVKNKTTKRQKIKAFFKKNSYALVVAGCTLVVSLSLVLTAIARKNFNEEVKENNQQVEDVIQNEDAQASSTAPVVFVSPVKNYTMGNSYTDSEMVYNSTLNEYTTHLGIDFIVADGSEVSACLAGTIESIKYDTLNGTSVVVDHGNGLKTSYSSWASNVVVSEGDKVETGQVIGYASASAGGEAGLGAHLHLEASENGNSINPMVYLGEK